MSVIWAQLVIDGVLYGPQPFIVPIRDPKTMIPYPGVTVGDCGHKNGSNNIDNGYILFNNYRIPKDYALDRLSELIRTENSSLKQKVHKNCLVSTWVPYHQVDLLLHVIQWLQLVHVLQLQLGTHVLEDNSQVAQISHNNF
jgi:hypothetical protein